MLSEDDITDEAGNMLGGKRAAMQFAHNKVNIRNTILSNFLIRIRTSGRIYRPAFSWKQAQNARI